MLNCFCIVFMTIGRSTKTNLNCPRELNSVGEDNA